MGSSIFATYRTIKTVKKGRRGTVRVSPDRQQDPSYRCGLCHPFVATSRSALLDHVQGKLACTPQLV